MKHRIEIVIDGPDRKWVEEYRRFLHEMSEEYAHDNDVEGGLDLNIRPASIMPNPCPTHGFLHMKIMGNLTLCSKCGSKMADRTDVPNDKGVA